VLVGFLIGLLVGVAIATALVRVRRADEGDLFRRFEDEMRRLEAERQASAVS